MTVIKEDAIYIYYTLLNTSDDVHLLSYNRLKLLMELFGYHKDFLIIKTNKYGKPYFDSIPIYFNISHTKNALCIAITKLGKIGIDIEKMRDVQDITFIIDEIFNKDLKNDTLFQFDQLTSFFLYWTQLEAIIKATGKGFSCKTKNITFKEGVPSVFPHQTKSKEAIFTRSYYIGNQGNNSFMSVACMVNMKIPSIYFLHFDNNENLTISEKRSPIKNWKEAFPSFQF